MPSAAGSNFLLIRHCEEVIKQILVARLARRECRVVKQRSFVKRDTKLLFQREYGWNKVAGAECHRARAQRLLKARDQIAMRKLSEHHVASSTVLRLRQLLQRSEDRVHERLLGDGGQAAGSLHHVRKHIMT